MISLGKISEDFAPKSKIVKVRGLPAGKIRSNGLYKLLALVLFRNLHVLDESIVSIFR